MIIDQCSAKTDSLFPRLIIFIGKYLNDIIENVLFTHKCMFTNWLNNTYIFIHKGMFTN